MIAVTPIHPQHELPAGRYLLDQDGRLQPMRYRGFVRAVAIVNVSHKPELSKATAPAPRRAPRNPAAPAPRERGGRDHGESFETALARVQERRATMIRPAPVIDGARVAAAYLAKPKPQPKQRPAPSERAQSTDGCRFCGIPGFRGCDHFLPYRPEGAR